MDDVILSKKQKEMLDEIELCNRDVIEDDDEFTISFLKWHGSSDVPKIISETRNCITLNYEDFLNKCKVDVANKLENVFNLDPFIDAMEEINNNEIILYRHKLENILQSGLCALIQIQFLDSLVILRKVECFPKLNFDPDLLENMCFLMENLVKFHKIDLSTVTNEFYDIEKGKLTNNLDYTSPEIINQIQMNNKLQALSVALRKQHQCKIVRDSNTLVAKCHTEQSIEHQIIE